VRFRAINPNIFRIHQIPPTFVRLLGSARRQPGGDEEAGTFFFAWKTAHISRNEGEGCLFPDRLGLNERISDHGLHAATVTTLGRPQLKGHRTRLNPTRTLLAPRDLRASWDEPLGNGGRA